MKRCPTCERTFADDSLRFCLQDGTTLLSVSDAPQSFDPGATLHNVAPGGSHDLPTEILEPRTAPTVPQSKPAAPTIPHLRAPTLDARESAAQPRSSNRALLAGIISIAVLLLALVGIGVALLLRGQSEENRNTKTIDRGKSTANEKSGLDANSNASSNTPPVPNTNSSPVVANTNSEKREESPPDAAARVEAKILKDIRLTERDLSGLGPVELRRLRNTVYARHGRTFDTAELQRYFESRPWYRSRSDYSGEDLTPTDRENIKLIQATENGAM